MNKILLIAQREYSTRVRNKTFLISTFLLPIVMVAFIAGATFLGIKGRDLQRVAVTDPNNFFTNNLKNTSTITFDFPNAVDTNNYVAKGYTAILVFPKWTEKTNMNY
ncbi:MAG: hypothetical protein EAY75_03605, partial [Bacteroidetes bacterium]